MSRGSIPGGSPALVLDASLALAWFLPDERSEFANGVLEIVGARGALVPGLWLHEMGNALLMAQKRGRVTTAERVAHVERLLRLPIAIDPPVPRNVLDAHATLAERYGLTGYDAAYLDLALHRGLPLATQDKALKSAAAKAGVVLLGTAVTGK